MSAGEIAAEFDLTNATISYHLSTLKKADLIFETRYQKYIYYEINTSVFESVVMWLMQFQEDKDEPQKYTNLVSDKYNLHYFVHRSIRSVPHGRGQ